MKKIILSILTIVLSTGFIKADPNVTGFKILSNYLYQGKLKVNSNATSTSFTCQVDLTRSKINQNGTYIDEPVDLTFEILNIDKNGQTHVLATKRYTTSDFNGAFNKLETASMTAQIPSSYYSGQIRARYRYKFLDPNIENLYGKTSNDTYVNITYQIITTKEIEDSGALVNPFPGADKMTIISRPTVNDAFLWKTGSIVLRRGQTFQNESNEYYISFQGDGNLVLYKRATNQALWATNTNGKNAQFLIFQTDGNLVLSQNQDGTGVIWASNIYCTNNCENAKHAYFVFQRDGNLVMHFPINKTQVAVVGETQTYNRVSSHFGKLQK